MDCNFAAVTDQKDRANIKIIECPRDAMQGLHEFIPTEDKIRYLQSLLAVGFDTLDFGSFVSPKAIPQMRDTRAVLESLDLSGTKTKLLAIVANERGARDASEYEEVSYLGYPFSISETFQLRNTNATILESLDRVKVVQDICVAKSKTLVIYISMGFGNPYGDFWNVEIVQKWVDELYRLGVTIFQLSDTIGVAKEDSIEYLFSNFLPTYPDVEIGAHFHTTPDTWHEKVDTAWRNGCKRFDGTIRGFGGCPMAQDSLVGNMPSENLITYASTHGLHTGLDLASYATAMKISQAILH